MARRTSTIEDENLENLSDAEAAEAQTEESSDTESEETPETATSEGDGDSNGESNGESGAEATGGETQSEEKDEKPAEEPAEADLTPFITVVEEVVGARDESTGTLQEDGLEAVLKAYRDLPDTKARNRAKKELNARMAKGLEELNLGLAKAYLTLHDNMTTAAKPAAERKPADPKARWKQQLEVVTLAYGELVESAPDGLSPEDVQEVVNGTGQLKEAMNAWRAWLDRDETPEGEEEPTAPEADDRVKAAFRLVRGGKISGGGTGGSRSSSAPHDGPRRDIGKHILSAFADQEDGAFLTVAQIRAHKSDEYGDDEPSAGAISARLFPAKGTCTVEGIEPGTGGDKNQRGAYKRG